jgi:hypothetical protein
MNRSGQAARERHAGNTGFSAQTALEFRIHRPYIGFGLMVHFEPCREKLGYAETGIEGLHVDNAAPHEEDGGRKRHRDRDLGDDNRGPDSTETESPRTRSHLAQARFDSAPGQLERRHDSRDDRSGKRER